MEDAFIALVPGSERRRLHDAERKMAKAYEPAGRARRFAALVRKETYQVVRDPSSILIGSSAIGPASFSSVMACRSIRRARRSPRVEEATRSRRPSPASFEASALLFRVHRTRPQEFEDDLVLGPGARHPRDPAGFAADHAAGPPSVGPGDRRRSDPNTANFVADYAQGAVANWSASA